MSGAGRGIQSTEGAIVFRNEAVYFLHFNSGNGEELGADIIMFVVGDEKLRDLPSHCGFCFSQWRKQSHLLRMIQVWQGKRFKGNSRDSEIQGRAEIMHTFCREWKKTI